MKSMFSNLGDLPEPEKMPRTWPIIFGIRYKLDFFVF